MTSSPADLPSDLAETLAARLADLRARIARIDAELREPLDDDGSEQAVELEDDEPLESVERTLRAEAREVVAALERIEAGTYGYCLTCGGAIAPERLRALPAASRCIACAAAA